MFIPYLGEKSKFSNFIIPNIPSDISTYVEPFGGMYGIFFSLELSNYPNTRFIYNDINQLNSNLFEHLSSEKFMSLLEITKVDEKLFELCKEKITLQLDNQTKALYWLIILTCSFSQYDITKGRFKSDDEFESVKLRLKYGKSNLDKIEVYNLDYEKIIDKFDSKSTFFYLDPPYKGREHYYINHNFKNESHFELSRKLKNIKGKFALSYYNFPEMADWYSDCRIIKNKTLMGTEFLIMNY